MRRKLTERQKPKETAKRETEFVIERSSTSRRGSYLANNVAPPGTNYPLPLAAKVGRTGSHWGPKHTRKAPVGGQKGAWEQARASKASRQQGRPRPLGLHIQVAPRSLMAYTWACATAPPYVWGAETHIKCHGRCSLPRRCGLLLHDLLLLVFGSFAFTVKSACILLGCTYACLHARLVSYAITSSSLASFGASDKNAISVASSTALMAPRSHR